MDKLSGDADIAEAYKLSPLREAVVEFRFPADLVIESHRDSFFEFCKKEFPEIYLPNPPQPIQQYRFTSPDGKRTVISAINMLAYATQTYTRFGEFKSVTFRLADFFINNFRIPRLKRLGMRYVNCFPIPRAGGLVPIQDLLNLRVLFPGETHTQLSNLSLIIEKQIDNWTLISRINTGQDNGQSAIMVDFDCYLEKDLDIKRFPEYMDTGHTHIKKIFEAMVTDSYKKVMKGEVIQ